MCEKPVTKLMSFHFQFTMSTVHFTLVVKMEIKIQKELLMRLKKTCIFLMSIGFPVTVVTFYCASLKVNGKVNTGLKKDRTI